MILQTRQIPLTKNAPTRENEEGGKKDKNELLSHEFVFSVLDVSLDASHPVIWVQGKWTIYLFCLFFSRWLPVS